MIGFRGGFTTFSSFSLQTLDLLHSGAVIRASLNITLSVVFCMAAVALGHVVAERFAGTQVAIAQAAIDEEG